MSEGGTSIPQQHARHHATADAWIWLEREIRDGNMQLERAASIIAKLMEMDDLLNELDSGRTRG